MNDREIFNTVIATTGVGFTYLFGGWDNCIIALVLFMALDYTTGVIAGYIKRELSSDIGRKGILKKFTIIIVLIIAVILDRLLNNGAWVFRTLVCYFYIANEGISLLENAVKIGIPVPEKIVNVLEQLKKKEEV